MNWVVEALLTGKARAFRGAETSAIAKAPTADRLSVGFLGIAGDEQADPRYHGGPDKAIHHYPRDHYRWWADALGDHPLLAAAGAFGENISTAGLIDTDACIGDRLRLGSALVEISQGRQPCWKLGHRFGIASVTATMVASRRGGWYYRVIEEGRVAAGDTLALVDRPQPGWNVERVFALLIGGASNREPAALRALADMEPLSANWRARATKLLA